MDHTNRLSAWVRPLSWAALVISPLCGWQVQAIEWSNATLPVSFTTGAGWLTNYDYFEPRVVDSISLEVMPSFQYGDFRFGPHLDARMGWQITDTASVRTNAAGRGWLLGLAVRSWFTRRLYWQFATDFIGAFDFSRSTEASQNAGLRRPLATRFKFGYRAFESIPELTLDLDFSYLMFRKVVVGEDELESATQQFMIGVGATYRFGIDQITPDIITDITDLIMAPTTKSQVADNLSGWRDGKPFEVALPNITFAHNAPMFDNDSIPTLKALAEALSGDRDEKIIIDGYSENTADQLVAQSLSLQRAESVKAYFVSQGLTAERIEARGKGAKKPASGQSGDTSRVRNRFVHIRVAPVTQPVPDSHPESRPVSRPESKPESKPVKKQ